MTDIATPLTKSPKQKLFSAIKTILLYSVMFIVIYGVVNWWRQPVMPANPELTLTDYQGQTVDLATLSQDQPVLVYFWGTWCPVCKTTSPAVNRLSQSSNYPVVTVAVKSGSNHELGGYLSQHDYAFSTINDDSGAIFNDWQGQVTPSFVILKDGKMKQGLTGIQPEWSLKLRLWLSSLG